VPPPICFFFVFFSPVDAEEANGDKRELTSQKKHVEEDHYGEE